MRAASVRESEKALPISKAEDAQIRGRQARVVVYT